MSDQHEERVHKAAQQARAFYETRRPFRVFHGSTNSTRILSFKKDEILDLSAFTNVLDIDTEKRTAVIESNVPMDKLARKTLRHGLIPPVVMEFPGITVGGAIQGNGGESSSFKWGCFNQTCNWYQIVLPDGQVIKATPRHHQDLFYGLPGTAGTLGILVAAEIQLVPAKPYVELTYTPTISFGDMTRRIKAISSQKVDFVDGIMFSRTSGVIISGILSDRPGTKIVRFSRARDQWYYLHVESALRSHTEGWTESVPIEDYLFRYDRGAFWVGRFAFELFGVPYTRFTRWALNPILHTRKLYQALQESGASQQHIVQDLVLPEKSATAFLRFVDAQLAVYPLWICPMLPDRRSSFQLNNINAPSLINVGVWGPNIPDYDQFVRLNRLVEEKTLSMGGKKWSYAHSYFTKKEFWSMYAKPAYLALRKKYHAEHLPDLYSKLTVNERYPINHRKGALKTIFGLARLRIKQ
jgi:Delta24-sterol reductase